MLLPSPSGLFYWELFAYSIQVCLLCCVITNIMHKRTCKVLSWNVRGINSDTKWDSIRNKITESGCDILCLQEMKKASINSHFLKKICPTTFDSFAYIPSRGASGGMLVSWKASLFLRNNGFLE